MNSSQLIEKLNKFYDYFGIRDVKYCLLITGQWGIGKTYSWNKFMEGKEEKYYYSLFGLKSVRELEQELLKDSKFPTFKKVDENTYGKIISTITKGIAEDVKIPLNTLTNLNPMKLIGFLNYNDLSFSRDSVVCLDDLERTDIPMKELMGFIERLKQKTNIIILSNEEEIKNKKIYNKYKEKVIDFRYKLTEVEDEVIKEKLLSLKLSSEQVNIVIEEFRKYAKSNVRVLDKFIHLYNGLILDLEDGEVLNERIRNKLSIVCFYVVCENELNLVEEYIIETFETTKRAISYFNKEIGCKEEDKKEDLEKRKSDEDDIRNRKYESVYEIYMREVCDKIERYFLGEKNAIEDILNYIDIRTDETSNFLNNKVKKYYLLDECGYEKLSYEIEDYVDKKSEENYNLWLSIKLYIYYLYLCKIADRVPKNRTTDKLVEVMKIKRNKLGNEYYGLGVYLDEFRDDISNELKSEIEELGKILEHQDDREIKKSLKVLIKEKKFKTAEEKLKSLKNYYSTFHDLLDNDFSTPSSEEEWGFWNCFIRYVIVKDRNKLEELKRKIEFHPKMTYSRRKSFLRIIEIG